MATPAGINQAARSTQQQSAQTDLASKEGASKFDQALAKQTDAMRSSQQLSNIQSLQQAQSVQKANDIEQARRTNSAAHASLQKARADRRNDPVKRAAGSRKMSTIKNVLVQLENQSNWMDRMINQVMNGKIKLDPQQLIGLQARVTEYSCEIELAGKVVEKVTTGLKDTLRIQV